MEVAACIQKTGSPAAALMASLNLQRERAQFCDCVVRHRQNPGQLYCAHRCVLAASSPVLASILSSTGALVELQAPCLSDSVLALVLDYIYTGALPYIHSQQQYYNLLTAASYLQMDELQETLRTEVALVYDASTGAENQPHKDINNTFSKDTCSVSSLEGETDSDEIDTQKSSNKNGANKCSRKGASPLSYTITGSSVTESTGSGVNTGSCRKVICLTPQELIQNVPYTTGVHGVSKVDKEVLKDQFHPAGTVKPESWPMSTEEEPVRRTENRRSLPLLCTAEVQEEEAGGAEKRQQLCLTVKSKAEEKQAVRKEEDNMHHSPLLHISSSHLEDNVSPRQCSSSSSPTSPHPCCGAVPVIRHSSTAAMAEVSSQPVSQDSVSSSNNPDSRSGSTERLAEGVTAKHKNRYRAKNQDDRNNKDHIGTKSWDHKDSSDQCAIQDLCYKSNAGQSDICKQDYNSSYIDHDEHVDDGLSFITDDNDAHRDSFQNKNHTKHLRDDFPSKHQRLDCPDYHNVSMLPAAKDRSIHNLRAVVSLPAQRSDTGSDSYCEELCPRGEAKEEHSYSRRRSAEMDSNRYGPKNDRYPNLHRAETSTKDAASIQHEQEDKDTAMDNITGSTSLEQEISEPHLTFTMPVSDNMSDPAYSDVGQSYRGHLHYHCLPQEDTHISQRDSDCKNSHPSHPDHSDQSNDEEEVGTFASPLRQHFTATNQVLLLDISAKPAEFLVSYSTNQKWVASDQEDTFENGTGDNDREQQKGATSAAGVDKRRIRAREIFEGFGEADTKQTNDEERNSVCKEQSRPGAEVIHKTGGVAGENRTTTVTVCSPPTVPDSVQGPVSSTLSVCIPSSLSANMPTNISAHMSTPVHHPFQCSLCDRSFSQRGSLNRHVRSHLGVRPFPCPRCPMTFSRQYRVSEHMRVHQRCVLGSDFQKPPAS